MPSISPSPDAGHNVIYSKQQDSPRRSSDDGDRRSSGVSSGTEAAAANRST